MAGTHKMGWVRDLPDHRDVVYSAPMAVLATLPPAADLRTQCPPVYDQGPIGSCTANAIAGAIQFDRRKAGETPDFVPSRLFVYWNERSMEHSVPLDAGARIRDGIKSVAKLGVPPETDWPYVPTPADPQTNLFPANAPPVSKPPTKAFTDAKNYQAIAYFSVQQTLTQMKGCLAAGFPFVFGFTVYDSMWDANGHPVTNLPMPAANDKVAGGHAVTAVGYDDARQVVIVRNSWGSGVQDGGYFYMPYAYITDANLADDFWTIRRIEA